MKNLEYSFAVICRSNVDGSYVTRANRKKILLQIARQIAGRYQVSKVCDLKPKHCEYLLTLWSRKGISSATQMNRLAALRWALRKVQRQQIIPRTNRALGLIKHRAEEQTRIIADAQARINDMGDVRWQLCARLQLLFGLRRDEALKFRPVCAVLDDKIALKGSWCKGGRPRSVPVRTPSQRALLTEVARFAGAQSMIPADLGLKQARGAYDYAMTLVGLRNTHALRHQYAAHRYRQLCGLWPPVLGGPLLSDMSESQAKRSQVARFAVSKELGHGRLDITNTYLGRANR